MKKFSITILYMTLIVLTTSAQGNLTTDCSADKLKQLPGTWKAGMQGSIKNVTPADLVKEKATTAAIHSMLTTNYKPIGCQISYNSAFGKNLSDGDNFIADHYYYSMYILRYLCDPNSADKSKYYVDVSTPTTVNIVANAIYNLRLYAANIPDRDYRGFLQLENRPEKKDAVYFMGKEKVSFNEEIYEYRWLITYNDTLPFSYINRKEFLLLQRKRLERLIKDSPSQIEYLQKNLDNINAYLLRPESDLNQDAISMWRDEERFEKFVVEGTEGSFIAIKPNRDYYKKGLPKSAPQFFNVIYKIDEGNAIFKANMAAIEKAVDFDVLKSMLGK